MRGRLENRAPLDALILLAIELYQRRISPRKSWRCAHRVLHGGAGCSGAVRSAVESQGWRVARSVARQRFRECKLAAQILRAQSGPDEPAKPGRKRRKTSDGADSWCDSNWCFCLDAAFDCGPGDVGCCGCTPCN